MMTVLLLVGIPISIAVTVDWTDKYIQFVKDFTVGSWEFYVLALILSFVVSLLLEFVEDAYR